MNEEKNRNIIIIYVVLGIAVIVFWGISFLFCYLDFFNVKHPCKYVWLSPVLKLICFALTVIAITIISKYILDYEAKINHDALSFEKAKMISERISTPEKKEYEKTININIKKE